MWLATPGNLYVGRQHPVLGDNGLGNPHRVGMHGRAVAVERFRSENVPNLTTKQVTLLRRAAVLGCWCNTEQLCHADALLEICV